MNWLAVVLVGGAAAWFEYNYQRSRHKKSSGDTPKSKAYPVPESGHVEQAGAVPSISPAAENDKKLNTTA
jgi:hypothetical protein